MKFDSIKAYIVVLLVSALMFEGCFANPNLVINKDGKILDKPVYQDEFRAKTVSSLIKIESKGPDKITEDVKVEPENKIGTEIINLSTDSNIYIHDGIAYVKGEEKGKFSLSGYCACTKCTSGTGITYSGKPVREQHTVAADKKVLPIGTVIILENAVGKDGQVYDGVYVVEDIGGGVKNNHLDIYRPTHDLASLVTYYGRAYGNVYIADVYVATSSELKNK